MIRLALVLLAQLHSAEADAGPGLSFPLRLHAEAAGRETAGHAVQVLRTWGSRLPSVEARRLEAQQRAATQVAAALQAHPCAVLPLRRSRARWEWPLDPGNGAPVVPWGERRTSVQGAVMRHTGWSFPGDADRQVRAVMAGVVLVVEWVAGLGPVVVVAHAPDLHTVYAGILRPEVMAMQCVAAGDALGHGVAVQADGERELYFEVRVEGIPVDPSPWFRRQPPP
jgi:septal ring factor EnvC (AmiA/AmiB activator)